MNIGYYERTKGISGTTLKWIAVISMIIDHFNSFIMKDGVIAPYKVDGVITFDKSLPFLVYNYPIIDMVCDVLGSIAFPIFCFLLAEGFTHTRNKLKYGIRLGIFALISEIPFNIAHYQELFQPRLQNVMFTLCISLFTLMLLEYILNSTYLGKKSRYILSVSAIALGMVVAYILRGEYVFLGVLCVSLLYLLRDKGIYRLLGFAPLMMVSPWILLALIPIYFYNGTRGRGNKYFFYIFYPTHFLIFAFIANLLANR